jgi:hypothetical protein
MFDPLGSVCKKEIEFAVANVNKRHDEKTNQEWTNDGLTEGQIVEQGRNTERRHEIIIKKSDKAECPPDSNHIVAMLYGVVQRRNK